MKNLRFVTGLFFGLITGAFLCLIVTCKSEPASQNQQVPNSYTAIEGLQNSGSFYKLTVDNIQYIVVRNANDGGIAIIKHR